MTHRPLQALMLTLLTAALLLSACQNAPQTPTLVLDATPAGGTPPESAATPKPSATAAPQATATSADPLGIDLDGLEDLQIDFWHPWPDRVGTQVDDVVKEFNRTNEWGLRVRVKPFYGASALADAVDPGRPEEDDEFPEVVAAGSEQLSAWARTSPSLLADLSKYSADLQVGLSEAEINAYQPEFWVQDQSGDMHLGLPALRGARVMFYNQTWAEELGFTAPPSTPDEFKQQACAAATANNAARTQELYGTGGWLIDYEPLTTLSWLGAFGADPIPAQEGQPYAFESPEAEAALLFLRGLISDGCAWDGRSLDKHEYFSLRRALFFTVSLTDIYEQDGWQEHAKSSDHWSVLAFPGSDGQSLVYSAGYSYAVTSGTPEEQLAGWLFAHWMSQPSVAAKLAQALPSLPVSEPVAAQFTDYRNNSPWNQIMPLMEGLRPAPALASWLQARRLLEDAGWQVYHLPPEILPEVLPQLDQAVQEMIAEPDH